MYPSLHPQGLFSGVSEMISVKIDTSQVTGMLGGAVRQMPFAISLGLNWTAQEVKKDEITEMKRCFDRPTPFTLNSLQLTPAHLEGCRRKFASGERGKWTDTKLTAEVWFKGQHDHYLLPQIEGGGRPLKPWEMGMGGKHFIIPSVCTQLDQYGNLGRGMITKLRSLYGQISVAGFDAATKAKSKRAQYFMLAKGRGKLPAGIYERVQGQETAARMGRYLIARGLAKKNGVRLKDLNARTKALYPRGIKPVVIFTQQAPNYRQRFDFYGVAQRTIDRVLMPNMRAAVDQALKTARAYQPGLF